MEEPKNKEEVEKAIKVITITLLENGNNYMETAFLAGGRMFKMRIELKEIIE